MMKKLYDSVMNENNNAFNTLPKMVRFQLMTILAYMWSTIFSLGIGSYIIFGTSLIFHLLFLIGIFFTADLFRRSREQRLDHRAAFRDIDGGARYDDIWGGA